MIAGQGARCRALQRALSMLLAALVCVALGCAKTVRHAGGLELVIATDLQTPSDFDMIHLEISQETASTEWHTLVGRDVRIPSESTLPTTYSIAAGGSDDQEALIVVTALRAGVKVVERVVQTQVPKDRVAELRMVLISRCLGKLTCPEGESCQPDKGLCGSNVVDSTTLPVYVPGSEVQGVVDASDEPDATTADVLVQDVSHADVAMVDASVGDVSHADVAMVDAPVNDVSGADVAGDHAPDPVDGGVDANDGGKRICVPQTTQCSSGNAVQTCVDGQWVDTQPCTNQVCRNAVCEDICATGATKCADNASVQTCTDQKQWGTASPCPVDAPTCIQNSCTATPSCQAGGPGQTNCGPTSESCCTALAVPGGAFYRERTSTTQDLPATVSDFRLEKYPVTVGRFRAFVNAGMGTVASPPAAGAGANPHIAGSGWDPAWNNNLLAAGQFPDALKCNAPGTPWTDNPAGNENRPIACITWFEAFAFCVWDGGRLPTEAEALYAAFGGNDERTYPWSNPPSSQVIDCTYANYLGADGGTDYCVLPGTGDTDDVGSESPKDLGRWGQSGLAGNVRTWALDWLLGLPPVPCDDCAALTQGSSGRVLSGGDYMTSAAYLVVGYARADSPPAVRTGGSGVRCAKSP